MNIFLDEDIVKEWGRELHSKDGMRDMARCWMILDELIQHNYNNDDKNKKYGQIAISEVG